MVAAGLYLLLLLFASSSGQDFSRLRSLSHSGALLDRLPHDSSEDVLFALETFRRHLGEALATATADESECFAAWGQLETKKQVVHVGSTKNITVRADVFALDSFGKPGAGIYFGNLAYQGSFDQCLLMSVGVPMQYCLMTIVLVRINVFPPQPIFNFNEALCIPQNCSSEDIFDIVETVNPVLEPRGLMVFVNDSYEGAPLYYCTQQEPYSYPAGAIFMLIVCSFFALMAMIGSIYHLVYNYYEAEKEERDKMSPTLNLGVAKLTGSTNNSESDPLISNRSKTDINSRCKTYLHDCLIAFSLYKTVPAVMATHQPPSAITSLNGMRVISMFWVILCHTYFFLFAGQGFKNIIFPHITFARSFSSQPILNGFFSVDSFFFLSGFLVSYLTFREMTRRNGKFPYLTFYLHRILRLTPTYMFVLFFFWFLSGYLAHGPKSPTVAGPGTASYNSCLNYWWTNLLYINNFWPTKFSDQCMGWTWYLANDMQFFVITPLYILLLYTSLPMGILALGITLLASMGVTGFIGGYYEFPANVFYNLYEGIIPNPNKPTVDTEIYGKPYCRIGPYLVGILLGYIIFKNYRINFSKTLNWICYIALWILAIIFGMSTVYGFYSTYHGHRATTAENVIYFMLARTAWGVALAIVIYACHNGYGGIINKFLSLPMWVPLSRLTFNAYLVHEIIILAIFTDLRDTLPYVNSTMAVFAIGLITLAYGAAGIVTVFVEFPLSNIEMATFKLLGVKLRESTRRVEKPLVTKGDRTSAINS